MQAQQLKEQVASLQGILARKATIPVLGTIKIEANANGALTMTATDMDVSLSARQEVDVLEDGSICLSGRKLGEIAAGLPNEPVHLKLDAIKERVEFRAGRFNSKLSGTSSDRFPQIPRVYAEAVRLPASVFYEGLRRTIFAVTEDNKRLTVSGILLVTDGFGLKMVSTDGARLCCFETADSAANPAVSCLIPIKAARALKNLLAGEIRINPKSDIRIKKGSHIEFELANKQMTAREVAGNFPNWEMVIPQTFDFFAEINANDFKNALTRVGVMADDAHRRVEFVFFHNKLLLQSESAETGNSAEEIGCAFQSLSSTENESSKHSDGWKIAFNTKYLMDFLGLQNGKTPDRRIIWKFGKHLSQSLLTFDGEERLFSYVLVPLK